MSNALKKITTRAKQLYKGGKGKMSWRAAIKQAGREYKSGKRISKPKKHRVHGVKKTKPRHRRRIGSASPHRDGVDRKRVDISIGSVRAAAYDKLAVALIAKEKSTTAKQFHHANKRITQLRKEIRALC